MRLSLPLGLAAVALATLSCSDPDEALGPPVIEPWVGTGKTTILVDAIHQWEARPDFVFDEDEHRYCHSQSTSRLLSNLIEHDFRYRMIREGALTDQVLDGHDVVFVNVPTYVKGGRSVPDRELPRLRAEEVEALERFVRKGGGLLVLAEHNNAYDNAEVLKPLLAAFGIRVPAAYARDRYPDYAIDRGGILLKIRNYRQHPVTRRLRATSWLGGAPLDTEHGVAFLSDEGHVDHGNYITREPSKESNRRVDPGERHGPGIPLIAAAEVGRGRVVALGDHNVIGVQWLGVADNYRFAVNAFTWLARRESEVPHPADARPQGLILGFDLPHTNWNVGIRDRQGFHPAFINFSRDPRVFAMGLLDLDDPADVLVLLDPSEPFGEDELLKIERRLDRGERVVLAVDPSLPQAGSLDLLRRFVPDLVLETPAGGRSLADLRPGAAPSIPRISQPLPVHSEELDVDLPVAALRPGRYRGDRPEDIEDGEPFLLDLYTEAGVSLAEARTPDGRSIAILRRIAVRRGELVLMLQAKMWSNDTFGAMRDEPVEANRGAYELQIAFLKWLAGRPAVLAPGAPGPTAVAPTRP